MMLEAGDFLIVYASDQNIRTFQPSVMGKMPPDRAGPGNGSA